MISMVECQSRIHHFEDIRRYVTETLSSFELLQPKSAKLTWKLLTRNDQACGVYFCLQGPRAVRLTAIWETDANSILFYGSCGQRVQRTHLLEAPQLQVQACKEQAQQAA
ncbi:MAG: hypothetical protein MI725_13620 [Pirellulales bacterium]|nr:hypothetical protein [Pirellulales bacterium]